MDKLTISKTVAGLIKYQYWRRGGDCAMPDPKELGAWIDYAIEVLEAIDNDPELKERINYE